MDIRDYVIDIRKERNKSAFTDHFRSNPDQIKKLIPLITNLEEYPYKEYASWILTHLCRSEHFDMQDYYEVLVDTLFKTKDQTVLRNVTNCISYLHVTSYRESDFIDLLISFIQDHSNKVALHVYSIYVLIQFVQKYPELKPEIEEIIELNSRGKSAAYKVAQRNFYKRTDQL